MTVAAAVSGTIFAPISGAEGDISCGAAVRDFVTEGAPGETNAPRWVNRNTARERVGEGVKK